MDADAWLVLGNSRTFPKAIIRRIRDRKGVERFQLYKWDLNPKRCLLMGGLPRVGLTPDL
ncbi:hypothetical protein ACFOYW_18450 [Gryllotalpicola reticulitermitis]|uniref:Uncharacterized protein n=1 Tax=Gryllotalpicola reticulitermitis TaxID=1184153 RepID=A0ABV8QDD7_9MICO